MEKLSTISKETLAEQTKEKAIEILTRIQRENPQLQAIYLWGSVLTDDYDPENSDIDSIAIVDEDTDPDMKDHLNEKLGQELPHLKINFLYPSALNGGEPKTITKFVAAEALLYDLPSWQHVAGRAFRKEEFLLGNIDLESVIAAVITSVNVLMERRIREDGEKYPIKGLARLCYLIHQRHLSFKVFRYADLVPDATDETREVCEKIMLIKKAGYPKTLIMENLRLFTDFLESLSST